MIGGFAHDRGCRMDVLWQCEVVDDAAAPEILAAAGWATGDRQALALDYARELADLDVTLTAPPEFGEGNQPFVTPTFSPSEDGYLLEFWWRKPSGDSPEDTWVHEVWTFSEEGAVVRSELERYRR